MTIEFTDTEGDVFSATRYHHKDRPVISLMATTKHGDPVDVVFFVSDAPRIIELIQEAAK